MITVTKDRTIDGIHFVMTRAKFATISGQVTDENDQILSDGPMLICILFRVTEGLQMKIYGIILLNRLRYLMTKEWGV